MSRGAFSEGFTTRKFEPDGAQCTVWQGARHRIDPTALCGAQGARVARQGMRSRHAQLACAHARAASVSSRKCIEPQVWRACCLGR